MVRFGRIKWAGLFFIILIPATPAQASLLFNTVFDSSVTAEPNAAAWESAFNYATSALSSLYSNNITINLTLDASSGTSILGESSSQLLAVNNSNGGYSTLRSALVADATDATDASVDANLPATDPSTGPHDWVVTTAQAKALGLLPGNEPATDGTITIGDGYSYTFDPNNRSVINEYDFIGIAEHEITEVMGRIGLLGVSLGSGNLSHAYGVLDLLGYTAPGDMSLGSNDGVYFSIDGGVTDLFTYNNPGDGGDQKDWASGQANDSFNAFTSAGVENNISAVDIEEVDAIGYTLSAPEPASICSLLLGLAALGYRLRRRA